MASEFRTLKYLPATFGFAVLLIASTSLAEERSAQKQFVNHNDSMMLMQIGDELHGMSTLAIYYEKPSKKMSQLVEKGSECPHVPRWICDWIAGQWNSSRCLTANQKMVLCCGGM
jgi:hypothetical protein